MSVELIFLAADAGIIMIAQTGILTNPFIPISSIVAMNKGESKPIRCMLSGGLQFNVILNT